MKYSSHLNLGEGFCIFTSFHFPDSGLYLYSTVLIFILIYFELCDTENKQCHDKRLFPGSSNKTTF